LTLELSKCLGRRHLYFGWLLSSHLDSSGIKSDSSRVTWTTRASKVTPLDSLWCLLPSHLDSSSWAVKCLQICTVSGVTLLRQCRHILRFILSTLIFYVQICQRLKNSEKHGTASKFYFFNILGLPCHRMRPRNNFKIFLLLIYVCSHRIIKKIPSFDIKDEQLINIIIGFLFTHFLSIFTPFATYGSMRNNHVHFN
jgi:hypothetical protein